MTNPVTLEGNGHTIEVHPLTIGERIDRADLFERFAPELKDGATARERELQAHRSNFIYVSAQSSSATFKLASAADTDKSFETKFAAYTKLTDSFTREWIDAVNALNLPKLARHTLPTGLLSEAERQDPE